MTAVKKWNSTLESIVQGVQENLLPDVELCHINEIKNPPNPKGTIAICEYNTPEIILENTLISEVQHFVQSEAICFEKEIKLSELMISQPKLFFKDPCRAILYPEECLKGESSVAPLYSRKFSELKEKYEIMDEIESSLSPFCKSSSFIYDVQSIADEMVTNAIFHATLDVDNRKNHMLDGHHGEIFLAKDDSRLIVACRDPHGKLVPERLFKRIYTCYTSEVAEKINMGKGGAGIGSFLVHNMSSTYVVAVNENVQTIICSLIPLNMSNRKRIRLPKNLHYLYLKETDNE